MINAIIFYSLIEKQVIVYLVSAPAYDGGRIDARNNLVVEPEVDCVW